MDKRCSSTIVGRVLAFILFGMMAVSLIAVSMFFTDDVAQADSIETVDVNEYVDSDCFIDDQSQTIQTFANVVKTRNSGVNNIELAQIIPVEKVSKYILIIDSTMMNMKIRMKTVIRDYESRTYQPYVAGILGYGSNVDLSNNVQQGSFNLNNLNSDVSWTKWFKKYHHNQKGHFDEIANVA